MLMQTRSASRKEFAAAAVPSQSTPHLLGLPPEIKNIIYRFVFLQREQIGINSQQALPVEPSLLAVNKQIMEEASGIYCKENKFRFFVHDHDSSLMQKWFKSSSNRKYSSLRYKIRRSTNWRNLVEWLEAYYDGKFVRPGRASNGEPCIDVSLFSMVKRMKRKKKLSWEAISANLEDIHQTLIATNPAWARRWY